MALSRQLGMTFNQLMANMDEDELIRQLAYAELEPLPNVFIQQGQVLEMIGLTIGSKRFDPMIWHPARKPEEIKVMSDEEIEKVARRMLARGKKRNN